MLLVQQLLLYMQYCSSKPLVSSRAVWIELHEAEEHERFSFWRFPLGRISSLF